MGGAFGVKAPPIAENSARPGGPPDSSGAQIT